MTGFEHTFIAVACIAIAFYLGRYVGSTSTYMNAFEDGVTAATTALITQLNREFNLTLGANVEIVSDDEEDD